MTTVPFPSPPWQLRVTMAASVFLVPAAALDLPLPAGFRPVVVGGRAVVGVGAGRYDGGLAYDELVVTVLVRRGWRPAVTVPWIWVDSPTSRAGARELWAVPKELATFTRERSGRTQRTTAAVDDVRLVWLLARRGLRLPGAWPVPFTTAQRLDGVDKVARHMLRARLRTQRTRWSFAPNGPLAVLSGRRPLLSLLVEDSDLTFGDRADVGAPRPGMSRPGAAHDRNEG